MLRLVEVNLCRPLHNHKYQESKPIFFEPISHAALIGDTVGNCMDGIAEVKSPRSMSRLLKRACRLARKAAISHKLPIHQIHFSAHSKPLVTRRSQTVQPEPIMDLPNAARSFCASLQSSSLQPPTNLHGQPRPQWHDSTRATTPATAIMSRARTLARRRNRTSKSRRPRRGGQA